MAAAPPIRRHACGSPLCGLVASRRLAPSATASLAVAAGALLPQAFLQSHCCTSFPKNKQEKNAGFLMKEVKQFYEEYPYPSLPIKNKSDLTGKMHANAMKNILETAKLETTKLRNKRILDAGCGTGEKALYFALHGARVAAFDFSSASIKKAKENAKKMGLRVKFERVGFEEWNSKEEFDHVFCLGVLHHTGKPREYFSKLCKRVKKGGTLTVGLYNLWGRMQHRFHRKIIRLLGGESAGKRMEYASEKIYKRKFKSAHEVAFVADKYANPFESYHTLEQTTKWLEEEGFEVVGIHPKTSGNRLLAQIRWLFRKNGFYAVSGRKKRVARRTGMNTSLLKNKTKRNDWRLEPPPLDCRKLPGRIVFV